MDDLEKVERLREKADVSYEEAKKALDECHGDLLEAIVYLEKQGKVKKPKKSSYSTQYEEPEDFKETENEKTHSGGTKDILNRFFSWCGRMVQRGNETIFKVERNGKNIIRIPVTVFVILLILLFEIVIPLMIIGLFLECRYSFEGVGEVHVDVNKAMDRAADAADSIRNEFTDK